MAKDHYVPQFYLRNFEREKRFWVVDKEQKKSWPSNALKTAKEESFYTFREDSGKLNQDVEGKLAELEGNWRWLISRILDEGQIGDSQAKVREFIAFQFVRTPYQADRVRAAIEATQFAAIEHLLSDRAFLARFIAEFPEHDEASAKAEVRKGWFANERGTDVILSLSHVAMIDAILREKEGLAVVSAPESIDFITSDNPVNAWLQTGPDRCKFGAIGPREAQIWCPLSPRIGLYIGPPDGVVGRNRKEFAVEMNHRIVFDARRYLIGAARDPDLEELAYRLPVSPGLDEDTLRRMAMESFATGVPRAVD